MTTETSTKIIDIILNLCDCHKVIPLFAFRNGSKAYGYDNANSDDDILFVYYRNPLNYLSIKEVDNEIKHPEMDIKGWDIRKFIGILAKNGWNAYEALHNKFWTAPFGADEFLKTLTSIAHRNLDEKKITNTMLCCALRDRTKYLTNQDKAKKVKACLSFARMVLSARYLFFTKEYPPVNFESLVGTLEANLENKADFEIPYDMIAFLKFVMYTRKSMSLENIDFKYMDMMMEVLFDAHQALMKENDNLGDTSKMGYVSKYEKLLKEFFQSQLKYIL